MNVDTKIEDNIIRIKFNNLSNLIDLLMILWFYTKESDSIISKILLIRREKGIPWYNDITLYKDTNLLPLYTQLKAELHPKTRVERTHITEADLPMGLELEIYTLNKINKFPKLRTREEFIQMLYSEWVKEYR